MQCLIESYEHSFKIFREKRERCEQHWIGNYIEEAGILEGFLELGRWCKMEHPQRERRKGMREIPEKALRFLFFFFFFNCMVPELVPSPRETDMRVRGLLCNNNLIWIRHCYRKRRLNRSTILPPPHNAQGRHSLHRMSQTTVDLRPGLPRNNVCSDVGLFDLFLNLYVCFSKLFSLRDPLALY